MKSCNRWPGPHKVLILTSWRQSGIEVFDRKIKCTQNFKKCLLRNVWSSNGHNNIIVNFSWIQKMYFKIQTIKLDANTNILFFSLSIPFSFYKHCYSCVVGLERDKFDNKTVTFEEHIKEEHNMWHYLYFIVLVRVKDSTEYTGPESYVAEMIKVNKCIVTLKPSPVFVSHKCTENTITF